MNKNSGAASLFILCLVPANPCYAADGASLEYGHGGGADLWRVGVEWKWQGKWRVAGEWDLGGYWDLQLGGWSGSGKNDIVDLGFTPVFRLAQTNLSGISPYFEGAIGLHLISRTRLDEGRVFSSAFQFGDHVGAGARFGGRGRYDLGLRVQHLSNAGIKQPNDGVNFTQIRFQHHFD